MITDSENRLKSQLNLIDLTIEINYFNKCSEPFQPDFPSCSSLYAITGRHDWFGKVEVWKIQIEKSLIILVTFINEMLKAINHKVTKRSIV